MILIDTHAHLYLDQFNEDRDVVIERAINQGIKKIVLPNIDSQSIEPLNKLYQEHPNVIVPLVGLHPTSVNDQFETELKIISSELDKKIYAGVGEIGIDLYWDKTYLAEQHKAFHFQLDLALHYHIPVVIHARESFNEIFEILQLFKNKKIKRGISCFYRKQATS
ncbi:MAG: hypothetical protein HC906_17800 [Bacteroidales bacterium]|nr:hypothetical protein [Bacteroidales bacterium]